MSKQCRGVIGIVFRGDDARKKDRTAKTARQQVYLVKTRKRHLQANDSVIKILGWFTAEETTKKLTFKIR